VRLAWYPVVTELDTTYSDLLCNTTGIRERYDFCGRCVVHDGKYSTRGRAMMPKEAVIRRRMMMKLICSQFLRFPPLTFI